MLGGCGIDKQLIWLMSDRVSERDLDSGQVERWGMRMQMLDRVERRAPSNFDNSCTGAQVIQSHLSV